MGMNLCHYIDTHQSLLQPTPRMGMNVKRRKVRKAQRELQHTPPYGDEQTAFELNYWSGVFQPTPPYGDEPRFA